MSTSEDPQATSEPAKNGFVTYLTFQEPKEEPKKPEIDWDLVKFLFSQRKFEEVVQEIGNISVEFQFLESELRDAIGYLLDENDSTIGAIVTEKIPFKHLPRVLFNLFDYKDGDAAKSDKLWEIMKECWNCEEIRNRLIHSRWTHDEKGAISFKSFLTPRKVRVDEKSFSHAEMTEITKRFKTCYQELRKFFEAIDPKWKEKGWER